jgi:hypothetical protein
MSLYCQDRGPSGLHPPKGGTAFSLCPFVVPLVTIRRHPFLGLCENLRLRRLLCGNGSKAVKKLKNRDSLHS